MRPPQSPTLSGGGGVGLLLAAHGSRREPAANALVEEHAARVRRLGLFDEVAVAFHQGHPPFAAALDQFRAREIRVVPLMTSAGYYSKGVLPRELQKNCRYGEVRLSITEPVGCHPEMAALAADRIQRLAARFALVTDRTSVALVGHGTPGHPESRLATVELAHALQETGPFGDVRAFFLDEPPEVEEIRRRVSDRDVIVLPFLIGGGTHAAFDLPRRLGLLVRGSLPLVRSADGRRIVIDQAVGTDPGIAQIVVKLATEKQRRSA